MRRDDFIKTLVSFLGTTENPPGSNRTPIGAEYGYNGVSWCAETVSVACGRLGFPLHEAAVIRIEDHARAGDWGMSWGRVPIVGAASCFDWKGRGNWGDMHVGVVTEVLDGGRFRTIEGNYQDACKRVLRDMTFVRGFAMFPFDDSAAPGSQPSPAPSPQPQPFGGTIVNGANRAQGGYALVGPDGGVFNYEGSPFFGSLPARGVKPNTPVVAMAWTLSGNGYWLLEEGGGVHAFGDAPFRGSYPGLPAETRNDPNRKFVAICARSDGGYDTYSSTREGYDF